MIQIRRAHETDLKAIHKLTFELGYSPSEATVLEGLKTLLKHPDYEIAVICKNDLVVGFVQLLVRFRVHDLPFLQIIGVVTDSQKRGLGYGKKLLQHAEARAKEKKLKQVGLYSNKKRTETHKFYKNYGFTEAKESSFFIKEV